MFSKKISTRVTPLTAVQAAGLGFKNIPEGMIPVCVVDTFERGNEHLHYELQAA